MEPQNCFICNSVSVFYDQNLFKIKSKHSETRLCEFIVKILGDYPLKRECESESDKNFVCIDCLNKIDEYDLACMTANRVESELRELLVKTESSLIEKPESIIEFAEPPIEIAVDDFDDVEQSDDETPNDNDDEEYVPPHPLKLRGRKYRLDELPKSKKVSIKVPDIDEQQNYRCKICDRNFKGLSALLRHSHRKPKALRNEEPKSHACDLCKISFNTKQQYEQHMKQHKDEDDHFKCPFCALDLKEEAALAEHRELHGDFTEIKCVLCHKVFKQKGALVRHMRIHSGQKFYQCDRCGKEFVHKSSFQMHILAHDDIRKKQCPHCNRMFRSSSHLNRHLRIHTGAKPYSCPICGQKFAQRYNMSVHKRLHDTATDKSKSDKIHLCNFCGSTFARKSKLEEHLQKSHEAVTPHTAIGNDLTEMNSNKLRTNT